MCNPENHHRKQIKETVIQEQLLAFTGILRGLGVRVSTAEVLDATRALTFVDITRKEHFKTSLAALLVKRKEDRALFDMAFEKFFIPPEKRQQTRREEQLWEEEMSAVREEAQREIMESVQESGGQWAGEAQRHLELSPEQVDTFANMPASERKRLQQIIESFEGNPVNDPSGLIADVVESSLNYWRYYMMKKGENEERKRGATLKIEYTGEEEIDAIIRAVAGEYEQREEESLLHRDLQSITEEDLPRVTALVSRLSRQLANRISRRYRRSDSREKIDFRRTVRRNLAYGGVPMQPAYRKRKVSRPRLLVLCDVSASMVRYARFVIQFIYGLGHVIKDVEIFVFSEDLERVTTFFKGGKFAETMSAIMGRSSQWGKTTDLNTALAVLGDNYERLLRPDTFFLVISDTKTQQPENAARRMERYREKVKDIIWLNTLPEREWEDSPTVSYFRERCRMFEGGTVAQLEQVLRRHLINQKG